MSGRRASDPSEISSGPISRPRHVVARLARYTPTRRLHADATNTARVQLPRPHSPGTPLWIEGSEAPSASTRPSEVSGEPIRRCHHQSRCCSPRAASSETATEAARAAPGSRTGLARLDPYRPASQDVCVVCSMRESMRAGAQTTRARSLLVSQPSAFVALVPLTVTKRSFRFGSELSLVRASPMSESGATAANAVTAVLSA
jgi:hypothetical protein